MKKNRGSNHSLQKKASAAVGSCLRSVRLPALLVLFLILFSFIFININYRNLDVSALRNAAASPDKDLSFFDTMPATPAPNNAGSVYQSKYEIVPGKVYKLGDCDKHVSDMQQRLMLLGICLPMNLRMFLTNRSNKPLNFSSVRIIWHKAVRQMRLFSVCCIRMHLPNMLLNTATSETMFACFRNV